MTFSLSKVLGLATICSALPLFLLGCSDGAGGCNDLRGPSGYNLAWDTVEVAQVSNAGTPRSIVVRYKNKGEIPVKVVIDLPVTNGEPKDIMKHGSLSRIMNDGQQFPEMDQGKVTIHDFEGAGKDASGQFNVTFKGTGGSINGEFCGKVLDEGF
jgi:hypothetical protein